MNLRVVLIIFLVLIFALGMGTLNYSLSSGIPVKQAYEEGKIQITQDTPAGTVPHVVTIKNNGAQTIKVEKGDLLISETSQDLVVAEDKNIPSNSSVSIKAYCFEPDQRSRSGSMLKASGKTSPAIQQIIENSDPSNFDNALKTQLQIWVIVKNGNVDPYRGEALKVVETQGMSFSELRQNISDAKIELMSQFNLKDEEFGNLTQNQTGNILEQTQNWINEVSNWIRGSLGI